MGNSHELLKHGGVNEDVSPQMRCETRFKFARNAGEIQADDDGEAQPVKRVKAEEAADPEFSKRIAALQTEGNDEAAGEEKCGDTKLSKVEGIVDEQLKAGPQDRANVFEKHGEGGDSANGIEKAQAVRVLRAL